MFDFHFKPGNISKVCLNRLQCFVKYFQIAVGFLQKKNLYSKFPYLKKKKYL